MRYAKCGYCSKLAPIRRDDLRYICLECTDFTAFGRAVFEAVSKKEPLNVIDKEPINIEQIECAIEGLSDFRKRISKAEEKYGSKQVPVVSVEALKKWCKENKHTLWAEKQTHKPIRTKVELIALHQILDWARKEAKKDE